MPTFRDADVLIVGAGPAGAIAALVLARAGARVRVLDRARFPRFKLCGDSVNPGALAILFAVQLLLNAVVARKVGRITLERLDHPAVPARNRLGLRRRRH